MSPLCTTWGSRGICASRELSPGHPAPYCCKPPASSRMTMPVSSPETAGHIHSLGTQSEPVPQSPQSCRAPCSGAGGTCSVLFCWKAGPAVTRPVTWGFTLLPQFCVPRASSPSSGPAGDWTLPFPKVTQPQHGLAMGIRNGRVPAQPSEDSHVHMPQGRHCEDPGLWAHVSQDGARGPHLFTGTFWVSEWWHSQRPCTHRQWPAC